MKEDMETLKNDAIPSRVMETAKKLVTTSEKGIIKMELCGDTCKKLMEGTIRSRP
jgi:hypothetical protein